MARGDAHISAIIDLGERTNAMERAMTSDGWTVMRTVPLRSSDPATVTVERGSVTLSVSAPSIHQAMRDALSAVLAIDALSAAAAIGAGQ